MPDRNFNKITYASPHDPRFKQWLIRSLEYCSGRNKIEKLYQQIQQQTLEPLEIWDYALKMLDIRYECPPALLEQIPAKGPLLLIANHPFGVVDGLILGELLARRRGDFFVMVNEVIVRQDERLAKHMLPIDFRDNKEAVHINIATRKKALEHLKTGGALAIFPAGGVATAPKGFGKAEELEWKRFTAKLIHMAQANVLPVYFHGQNSWLFHLASHLNETLRMSFLVHEVRNKMGRQLKLDVGELILYDELSPMKDRQQLLNFLQDRTFALAHKSQ